MLLATFELVPDGEAGGDLLIRALAGRGIDAAWAVWTDPGVDWSAADAVVVRSTWDYHRRLPEFLEWVDRVDAGSRLVNDARVLRWNADKRYLLDLADDLPVVPTRSVAADDLLSGLRDGLAEHGTVVVKPRVGASGIGVVVAARTDDLRLATLTAGPWVVQPFVESVRTEGETSVYVFGGRAVSQLRKPTWPSVPWPISTYASLAAGTSSRRPLVSVSVSTPSEATASLTSSATRSAESSVSTLSSRAAFWTPILTSTRPSFWFRVVRAAAAISAPRTSGSRGCLARTARRPGRPRRRG